MNSRQIMQTTTMPPKPASAPAARNGQVSQMVAWPPINSGMTGMMYPDSRSRRTTSWVATGIARATISTQKRGAKISVTTSTAQMRAPTAIAAGRSRPAREVFCGCCSFGCDISAPRAGSSGGLPAPASLVDTDVIAERSSDLQQLAFFVLDQFLDLGDVLMCRLVQILFRTDDLVLAGFAVFADAVQLLHRLAPDVAHRDLRVLAFALGLLDQLAAALLSQLRHGHPDQGAVVGGIHSQLGIADRRLDGVQLPGLVRLDHDQPCFGDVDAGQLGDRGGGAVVVDDDPGEHARCGSAGPDGRQIVAGHRDGFLHFLFSVKESLVDHVRRSSSSLRSASPVFT